MRRYLKIACLFLSAALCLSCAACGQRQAETPPDTAPDMEALEGWLALRRYQLSGGAAVFADRRYGEAQFDLYGLVWNLKAAGALGVDWALPEGEEYALLRRAVERQADADSRCMSLYGGLYTGYLAGQLYQMAPELFSPGEKERFVQMILSRGSEGRFREQSGVLQEELSGTVIAVEALAEWGYDLSQLDATEQYLLDCLTQLDIPEENTAHKNDSVFFALLRALVCFPDMPAPQLKDRAEEYLTRREASIFSGQIGFMDLSAIADAARITDCGLLDCRPLLRRAMEAVTDEDAAGLDPQSKYEYAVICRTLERPVQTGTEDIWRFLKNRLYLGQFQFSYESLCYGLLCAQLLDLDQEGPIQQGYRDVLTQQTLKIDGISELYFCLRLCRMSGLSLAETARGEELAGYLAKFLGSGQVPGPKQLCAAWYAAEELEALGVNNLSSVREQIKAALPDTADSSLLTDELFALAVLSRELGVDLRTPILEQLEGRYLPEYGGYSLSEDLNYMCLSATCCAVEIYTLYNMQPPHSAENLVFVRSCQQEDGGFEENVASPGRLQTCFNGLSLLL